MSPSSGTETAIKTVDRILGLPEWRGRWPRNSADWRWAARWAALSLGWRTGLPVTVRHFHDFGEDRALVGDYLVRPDAWDAIRTRTAGPFSVPPTRDAWERMADEWEEGPGGAQAIDGWLRARGVRSLASYGVGAAFLELWLHQLDPERKLIATDFAPATVARLATVFAEAEVRGHNLLRDQPLDAEVHLFGRIDTEFSNRQWRSIFRRFAERRILIVATEVIDLERARGALLRQTNPNATWAGYVRNRAAFEVLWRRTHRGQRLQLGDLAGWALEPKH